MNRIRTDLKRLRQKTKYDIHSFLRVKYDKLMNRVNGHSKKRYEGMRLIPRQEFYDWALNEKNLFYLYHNWIRGGYQLKDMPTVDRIDNNGGYVQNNIRWLTQSKNSSLGGKLGGYHMQIKNKQIR
jgi:hypothetical protein